MATKDKSSLEKLKHYCAYQERCHSEVRSKLLDLGVRGVDLEEIIATLIQEDYLNEERFAQTYVSGKLNIKNWGRIKIIKALKQKNVSQYCIQKAIKHINTNDYFDIAQKVINKKWLSLSHIRPEYKRKQKTIHYALQRGFELYIIQEILEHVEFGEQKTKD